MYCTNRLLSELQVYIQPKYDNHVNNGLGDWYSHLFDHKRRFCLIFVNTKTLTTFVIPDLLKKDLKGFHDLFINGLTGLLENLGAERSLIDKIIPEYIHLQIVKTESKSILGSMNDYIQHFRYAFEDSREIDIKKINEFNRTINEIPMGGIHMEIPQNRLQKILNEEYKKNTA